jgi:tetratricopeptide (TPR) repeat protein
MIPRMMRLSPEWIETAFAATTPRRSVLGGSYLMVLAIVLGVMLVGIQGPKWGIPVGLSVLVPVLVLAGFVFAAWMRSRRQQRCRERIEEAWEAVQLEAWQDAGEALIDVLGAPVPTAMDRGKAFLSLAAVAEQTQDWRAAALIYERMTLLRAGDATQLQTAQIALAAAKIRNEELTDALDMIGRLEQVAMPNALRAGLVLVRLFQQVFMGHHEDAVDDWEERRALFRRFLSTRAAEGYALLASAFHQLGQADQAAMLWRDATLLMKPDKLTSSLGVLENVAQSYRAEEHPV